MSSGIPPFLILPEVFPDSEIIRLIVLLLSCLFIEGHSASLNVKTYLFIQNKMILDPLSRRSGGEIKWKITF